MQEENPFPERSRKEHKSLSSRLKKKWDKQKQIQHDKKVKKSAYDKDQKKAEYHQKIKSKKNKDKKKDSYGVRVHKLKKALNKFIKVYEDQLPEFYDIWKGLDQGGQIQIEDVQNPQIRKCLKKMCKHLQLDKKDRVYSKPKHSGLNLESYVKRKMEEVIEDYLENGTESEDEDSDDEKPKEEAQVKKQVKVQTKPAQTKPVVGPTFPAIGPTLPPVAEPEQEDRPVQIGPFIPREQRQLIEKMFQQTIKTQQRQQRQLDQIDQLFGYQPKKKQTPQEDFPQQRYAKGSARLHQHQDPEEAVRYLEEYNKKYRNKSLMEQHKELLKAGNVEQSKPNERKPFTRESLGSDKVDTRRLSDLLKGGSFFDFKDKMAKPKDSSFL